MLFGKKKAGVPVCLDIGADSAKFVQIKEGGSQLEVEKLGVARLPLGALRDGFITDVKGVVSTVQSLLQANGVKAKWAVASLSGLQVVCRVAKLPPMEEKEVRQAIQYQAEQYIPFPIDQVELDIHFLGEMTEGDARKTAVLLVAAKKEGVRALMDALGDLGLRVKAVDISPFQILRSSIELNPDVLTKNVLFVQIGASCCELGVVAGRTLRFCRIIPTAGIQLTRSLATTLHLDFNEAERTKKRKGVALVDDDVPESERMTLKQLRNILQPTLSSLVNEINRSLAYYETRYRRSAIELVVLSGGTAKLRHMGRYLEGELGLPVTTAKPFAFADVRADVSDNYLTSVAPIFTTAMGLAYRESDMLLTPELPAVEVDGNFEFGASRQAAAAFS